MKLYNWALQIFAWLLQHVPAEQRRFKLQVYFREGIDPYACFGVVHISTGYLRWIKALDPADGDYTDMVLAFTLGHEIGHLLRRDDMLSCFALVAGLTSLTSAAVLGCVLGIGGWVAGVVTVAFTTRFLLSCKRECERRADSEGARLGRSALPGNGTLLRAVRELFRAPTSTREQLGASMSRAWVAKPPLGACER